ncbi:NAD(P)H-binding protein [Chitinophaga sp. LS1]|uniref:NmrA family NAD(P)-binding protein n=1 Tax=Chitinophaga sp. LS1 TaxID=3051176 RepID=UPI002AAB91DB|nr:NAD(P)H-binding protein [Chitinophaga sp. LS1]WPV65723.1 NAD(P)H-binding protein [Chitinophaga sp. LS1]
MKIIVTGSLGNISKPLAILLIEKGHDVTVISSDAAKAETIIALGAKPAIGSLEDTIFIQETFKGADAVYCMIPFNMAEQDQLGYFTRIANNYVQAIQANNIKRVINLSGWAAEVIKDHSAEGFFNDLKDVSVTHLRPGSFYSNFYGFIGMIKTYGMIMSNYGGDDMIAFVAPEDIADVVVEELETPSQGIKIRYVASDELTCNEAAHILGTAIGKPDLQWPALPAEQVQQGMEMMGMPKDLAAMLVAMQQAQHSGEIQEKYFQQRPVLGKRKLKDFAPLFAAAY